MAKLSEKIEITSLDFDTIKDNLKSFLQAQSEFSDYDFDGAGLNILLDVLAYNTHYSSFYANMQANEMFLDSADIRESVASHAKMLNFTIRSPVAPTAKLDFVFTPSGSPTSLTIAKDTKFTTTKDGVSYVYTTPTSTQIFPALGVYATTGVEIKEGEFIDTEFIVDLSDTTQRFIIPNKEIDTTTLTVIVETSVSDATATTFVLADDLNVIKGTDPFYWIHEVADEKFEIEFGNVNVGQALADGNVIKLNYLVTNGAASNKATTFSPSATVAGQTSDKFTLTVADSSSGGDAIQGKDEIKFLAPKLYQSQGRAVTELDYENVVKSLRSDLQSVKVWGGEEAVPAQFGQVFLALKPDNAEIYSDNIKSEIINSLLQTRNVVTITPNIVDPDFTYVKLVIDVNYDPVILALELAVLKTNIETTIMNYFANTLNRFDTKFRHSVLTGLIDDEDDSIRNNSTNLVLQKRFSPTNTNNTFTLSFNNSLETSSVVSEKFTFNDTLTTPSAWLRDDGNGVIEVVHQVGTTTPVLATRGTVDYTTGIVVVSNFGGIPDATNGELKLDVTPVKRDITSVREQLITIDNDDSASLVVTLVSEAIKS